jgi:hypothetical protein
MMQQTFQEVCHNFKSAPTWASFIGHISLAEWKHSHKWSLACYHHNSLQWLTNSTECSPSWKTNSCSAMQEIPNTGTWRFITVLTTGHNWSLSWARIIQSIPSHSIKIHFYIIFQSTLSLIDSLFPLGFLPKLCMHFSSLSCVLHA